MNTGKLISSEMSIFYVIKKCSSYFIACSCLFVLHSISIIDVQKILTVSQAGVKVLMAFVREHVSQRDMKDTSVLEGTMILVKVGSAQVLKAVTRVRMSWDLFPSVRIQILGLMTLMSVE